MSKLIQFLALLGFSLAAQAQTSTCDKIKGKVFEQTYRRDFPEKLMALKVDLSEPRFEKLNQLLARDRQLFASFQEQSQKAPSEWVKATWKGRSLFLPTGSPLIDKIKRYNDILEGRNEDMRWYLYSGASGVNGDAKKRGALLKSFNEKQKALEALDKEIQVILQMEVKELRKKKKITVTEQQIIQRYRVQRAIEMELQQLVQQEKSPSQAALLESLQEKIMDPEKGITSWEIEIEKDKEFIDLLAQKNGLENSDMARARLKDRLSLVRDTEARVQSVMRNGQKEFINNYSINRKMKGLLGPDIERRLVVDEKCQLVELVVAEHNINKKVGMCTQNTTLVGKPVDFVEPCQRLWSVLTNILKGKESSVPATWSPIIR